MKTIASLFICCILLAPSAIALAKDPPDHEKGANMPAISLDEVREDVLAYCEKLRDKGGPYGAYRRHAGQRTDLYASCDVAIMRTIMGEDFKESLTDNQRNEWIAFINSYQHRGGSYDDTFGHSELHANGMVISALGPLGGKQSYYVRLYDQFDTIDEALHYLEHEVNWVHAWGGSHAFWGGLHCYSMSSLCTPEWKEAVIDWLNEYASPETGWWKKDVKHINKPQGLGAAAHIYPIYEHHGYEFPYPKQVIDSVLDMQLENGRWREIDSPHVMSYLELDALYALAYCQKLAPGYRTDDIKASVKKYGNLVKDYWANYKPELFNHHPHTMLAVVGTFGLLQQHLPCEFYSDTQWSDIFSDVKFYQTAAVERLPKR